MTDYPLIISELPYSHRLGEILQEAELISAAQLEVALHNQGQEFGMLLGEVLASHGWIKQDTVDFFAEKWPRLIHQTYRKRLGEYLQAAALLDETQINAILKEQWQTGVKFGTLAVLRGWLKPATIDFFLSYLFPDQLSEGPLIGKRVTGQIIDQWPIDTSKLSKARQQTPTPHSSPGGDIPWIG